MELVGIVLEVVSLAFLTLTEIVVFITNGLSGSSNASKFGFVNGTAAISDKYYTQITPAGFTFSIWGVIYTWEVLWIIYAWSFVFRPRTQRTIFVGVYWPRIVVNCLNIAWIYLFGNEKIVASSIILFMFTFTFYISNGLIIFYFFKVQNKVNRIDKFLTYLLPINGMYFYNTWVDVATQINLAAAIAYNTGVSQDNSATIGLTILLFLNVLYFILECTILECYLRYVFSPYPVLIWASIGILSAHWTNEDEGSRNKIYTLMVLIISVVFLVTKIILSAICAKVRPHPKPQDNSEDQKKLNNEESTKYK